MILKFLLHYQYVAKTDFKKLFLHETCCVKEMKDMQQKDKPIFTFQHIHSNKNTFKAVKWLFKNKVTVVPVFAFEKQTLRQASLCWSISLKSISEAEG